MKSFNKILLARIKLVFRDMMCLFFAFLFPLMLVLIFGLIIQTSRGGNTVNVSVFKADTDPKTEQIFQFLEQSKVFKISLIEDQKQAIKSIEDNQSRFLLEIKTEQNKPTAVKTYYGFEGREDYQNLVSPILSGIASQINYSDIQVNPKVTLEEQSLSKGKINNEVALINGFILQSLVLYTIIGASRVIAEEREKNLLKRLSITNLKKWEYLVAYTLSFVVIGFAQSVVLILLSMFAFNVQFNNIVLLLLATIVVNIMISMIGVFIGTVSKNANGATGLAQLIGFPLIILAGAWFPLSLLPKFVQELSKYSPVTASKFLFDQIAAVDKLEVKSSNLIIIGLTILIFLLLSLKTFKFRKA